MYWFMGARSNTLYAREYIELTNMKNLLPLTIPLAGSLLHNSSNTIIIYFDNQLMPNNISLLFAISLFVAPPMFLDTNPLQARAYDNSPVCVIFIWESAMLLQNTMLTSQTNLSEAYLLVTEDIAIDAWKVNEMHYVEINSCIVLFYLSYFYVQMHCTTM